MRLREPARGLGETLATAEEPLALSIPECRHGGPSGYTAVVPTYEFRCENGHLTEVFQRMSDPPLERCGVCGAPVQKVLHPVAIHFKGSGFYNTDYGKGKGGKPDGAGGDGAGSGSEGGKAKEGATTSESGSGSGGSSSASGASSGSGASGGSSGSGGSDGSKGSSGGSGSKGSSSD